LSKTASPLEDGEQEALRLVTAAQEKGLVLRLVGGIAIKMRCKSAKHRELTRHYADIDMVGLAKQRKQLKSFFPEMGYVPRGKFNVMQGERLIFNDLEHSRRIDIFLDFLNMCHKLDFKDRLGFNPYTLTPTDLLMSKLQVVEATEREIKDILALLIDFPIEDKDGESINAKYIAELCANDWGIFKTFTINLDKIRTLLPSYLPKDRNDFTIVSGRLQELEQRIANSPKSTKWKLRAAVGEKKRWYELPEADKSIVHSTLVLEDDKLKAKEETSN
jgi:hypothetical protein